MITKYKLQKQIYIAGILLIGVDACIAILGDNTPFDIIFMTCIIIIQAFFAINILSANFLLNKEGIQFRSILKTVEIKWCEIDYISIRQPAGSLLDFSISIISGEKKVTIIPWIKDYKTLLSQAISNYQEQGDGKIDARVFDILNQK